MSDTKEITPLHVELPTSEYDELRQAADSEGRSLKNEVRRLIRKEYGMDKRSKQPVASNAVAT